jgi:hypothetical protein
MLRLINDKSLKLFLCRLYYETSFGEKLIKAFADKENLDLSDAYSGAIDACIEKPMRAVKGLSNMKYYFDK